VNRLEAAKRAAGRAALDHVEPGMRLGLGTGSTARHFVEGLGERVRDGLDVVCVPTSEATRTLAVHHRIPVADLDELGDLDLTVDGADELDDRLNLVKGGGGALLREKIVAAASRAMIVIADETKHVDVLGRYPLPVEVVRFGVATTIARIAEAARAAGCEGEVTLRRSDDGEPFVTDEGHLICDCAFRRIENPPALARALEGVPGVVEHGLFLGYATLAILGTEDGVRVLEP